MTSPVTHPLHRHSIFGAKTQSIGHAPKCFFKIPDVFFILSQYKNHCSARQKYNWPQIQLFSTFSETAKILYLESTLVFSWTMTHNTTLWPVLYPQPNYFQSNMYEKKVESFTNMFKPIWVVFSQHTHLQWCCIWVTPLLKTHPFERPCFHSNTYFQCSFLWRLCRQLLIRVCTFQAQDMTKLLTWINHYTNDNLCVWYSSVLGTPLLCPNLRMRFNRKHHMKSLYFKEADK